MTMSILCCITVNGLFGRVHAMKLTARRMPIFFLFFCLSKRWKSNPVLVSCLTESTLETQIPKWKKKKRTKTILMNIYASYLYSCQTFSKEKNDARGSFSWWWRRRWEREKLLRTKADDGISNFLFCFVLELVWKLKRIASLFPGQSKTTTFGNFWRVHGSTHSTAEEMSPVKEKKYNFFVCVCVCLPIWL